MLATIDFSIVLITLPTLTSEFATNITTVVWVSMSFQLVSLGLVLPAGRFGDLFGMRRVFAAGMFISTVGMLLAGLAPGILELIFARVVQGGGGALTNALSAAIVTATFPRNERGKALGILMSFAGAGMMLGPSVGGLLLDTLGWRWIFLLRVPLSLVAFVVSLVFLEHDSISHDDGRGKFDFQGSIVLFAAATAFALGVNQGSSHGFASMHCIALVGAAAMLVSTFLAIEVRSSSPVIDLVLFKQRAFAVGSGLMLLTTSTVVALTFLMPFYLILGKGLSPSTAGLVLLVAPSITIVASPIVGRLSDRVGPRFLTPLGLTGIATAFLWLSTLSPDAKIIIIVLLLGLSAVGSSLFNTPNSSAIMGAAPQERIGTVSALMPTLRSIGLIIGIAVAQAIYVAIAGDATIASIGHPLHENHRALVIEGVSMGLRVFGAIALLGVVLATLRGEDSRLHHHT
jgi:EmrB/QacA subfamily drug resistance transporter